MGTKQPMGKVLIVNRGGCGRDWTLHQQKAMDILAFKMDALMTAMCDPNVPPITLPMYAEDVVTAANDLQTLLKAESAIQEVYRRMKESGL